MLFNASFALIAMREAQNENYAIIIMMMMMLMKMQLIMMFLLVRQLVSSESSQA